MLSEVTLSCPRGRFAGTPWKYDTWPGQIEHIRGLNVTRRQMCNKCSGVGLHEQYSCWTTQKVDVFITVCPRLCARMDGAS